MENKKYQAAAVDQGAVKEALLKNPPSAAGFLAAKIRAARRKEKEKARRAGSISIQAKIAQQNLVNHLTQVKTEIELKIVNLTDLSPESTDSLRPGGKDWSAQEWATELQKAKFDLWNVGQQLKIATETFSEYFGEEE